MTRFQQLQGFNYYGLQFVKYKRKQKLIIIHFYTLRQVKQKVHPIPLNTTNAREFCSAQGRRCPPYHRSSALWLHYIVYTRPSISTLILTVTWCSQTLVTRYINTHFIKYSLNLLFITADHLVMREIISGERNIRQHN